MGSPRDLRTIEGRVDGKGLGSLREDRRVGGWMGKTSPFGF